VRASIDTRNVLPYEGDSEDLSQDSENQYDKSLHLALREKTKLALMAVGAESFTERMRKQAHNYKQQFLQNKKAQAGRKTTLMALKQV